MSQQGETALAATGRSIIFRLLGRLWIPLLAIVVISAGGFTVSRLHSIFGAEKRPTYSDTAVNENKNFNPKHMVYEVFGPPGTTASISYFDINSDPQFIQNVPLPWVLTFDITKATATGSIMAQGDSENIGCRITVDDKVKAEKVSNQVNAFTSCLLKAA
jgi:nitrate reductase NapE component